MLQNPAWWATWLVCTLNLTCSISSRAIFILLQGWKITLCTNVNSKQMRYRTPYRLFLSNMYSGKFVPSSLTRSLVCSACKNTLGTHSSSSSSIRSIRALFLVFLMDCVSNSILRSHFSSTAVTSIFTRSLQKSRAFPNLVSHLQLPP